METYSIGQSIAYYRKEKGLTQKELAERMGIAPNLVSHYEIGRLRVSADLLCDFSRAMNISADLLLGLQDVPNQGPALSLKVAKRMNQIEKLPPADQKILLRTIDNYLKGALPHSPGKGGAA